MMLPQNNIVKELKKIAIDKGKSLNSVCKSVGITRDVLTRWEKKEPKTIQILRNLLAELD